MNVPAVSVILPAYNCERFIGKAIQSVLQQTFTDFELIIINDGSTDNTEAVIHTFKDQRVVNLKNPINQGLVHTLNKAIGYANGNYIARMDADDICLQERLGKQKTFLDQHKDIAVVASTIEFINEHEEKTGIWELDRKTTSSAQIRRAILKQNCIAHPTVMVRSEIIKQLQYKEYQKNIEDYDLWLRLLNRGYKIAKLDEPLVLYRIHGDSVTSIHLKNTNPFFKHFIMKIRTLTHLNHFSGFAFGIFGSAILDLMKGIIKAIKSMLG